MLQNRLRAADSREAYSINPLVDFFLLDMSVEGFPDDDEERRGNWAPLSDTPLDGKSFGCLVVEIHGHFRLGECDHYHSDEHLQETHLDHRVLQKFLVNQIIGFQKIYFKKNITLF